MAGTIEVRRIQFQSHEAANAYAATLPSNERLERVLEIGGYWYRQLRDVPLVPLSSIDSKGSKDNV